MEKKEKLGFFKKVFLVITDFRIYPYLVKNEKILKSFAYLVLLVLLVSVILSVNIFLKIDSAIQDVYHNYDTVVPKFSLSAHNLNVERTFSEKLGSNSYLILDTHLTNKELKASKDYEKAFICDTITLITKDKIEVIMGEKVLYEVNFSDFDYELDRSTLYTELVSYSTNMEYKTVLFITILFSIFFAYLMVSLIKIIMIAFVISLISIFFGVCLNFANYIKISIYTYTLPLFIEILAMCFIGTIKNYVNYTTSLLTYVYALYAIRAIKLDAFLIMFSSKKNVRHTSSEFDSELKKYNEIVMNHENVDNTDEKEDSSKTEETEEEKSDDKEQK